MLQRNCSQHFGDLTGAFGTRRQPEGCGVGGISLICSGSPLGAASPSLVMLSWLCHTHTHSPQALAELRVPAIKPSWELCAVTKPTDVTHPSCSTPFISRSSRGALQTCFAASDGVPLVMAADAPWELCGVGSQLSAALTCFSLSMSFLRVKGERCSCLLCKSSEEIFFLGAVGVGGDYFFARLQQLWMLAAEAFRGERALHAAPGRWVIQFWSAEKWLLAIRAEFSCGVRGCFGGRDHVLSPRIPFPSDTCSWHPQSCAGGSLKCCRWWQRPKIHIASGRSGTKRSRHQRHMLEELKLARIYFGLEWCSLSPCCLSS